MLECGSRTPHHAWFMRAPYRGGVAPGENCAVCVAAGRGCDPILPGAATSGGVSAPLDPTIVGYLDDGTGEQSLLFSGTMAGRSAVRREHCAEKSNERRTTLLGLRPARRRLVLGDRSRGSLYLLFGRQVTEWFRPGQFHWPHASRLCRAVCREPGKVGQHSGDCSRAEALPQYALSGGPQRG